MGNRLNWFIAVGVVLVPVTLPHQALAIIFESGSWSANSVYGGSMVSRASIGIGGLGLQSDNCLLLGVNQKELTLTTNPSLLQVAGNCKVDAAHNFSRALQNTEIKKWSISEFLFPSANSQNSLQLFVEDKLYTHG